MAGFSNALAAKEYAARHISKKVWGINPSTSFVDHDPGSPPPTAPNPPPDDPTQNEVEAYMSAVNQWAMSVVRDAWDKGNP